MGSLNERSHPPKSAADTETEVPSVRELGSYEVVLQKAGFYSIRDKASGETLHSVIDPMVESELLYAGQSDLRSHLSKDLSEPLVIWDVGLGAATNAMAAVHEILALRKVNGLKRRVQIVSFENDLDSLRLALKNPSQFPHAHHPAPRAVATAGNWEDAAAGIQWDLLAGDFILNFEKAPAPDIIYYDMYSLKYNDRLWSMQLFKNIFDHCRGKNARLITYTVSTRTRAALLAAGFFVCYGTGSGPKAETTIAFTAPSDAQAHPRLLGKEWLGKWERSTAKTDEKLSDEEKEYIHQGVRHHKQFSI